jgi:hypothetical protein
MAVRPWFMLNTILEPQNRDDNNKEIYYYAGAYLKNMLYLLFAMQIFSLAPLILSSVIIFRNILNALTSQYSNNNVLVPFKILELVILLFAFIIALYIVLAQSSQVNRRRAIIESELHSINSFSMIWMIVSMIHYKAFAFSEISRKLNDQNAIDPDSVYFEVIAEEVENLCRDNSVFSLNSWMYEFNDTVKTVSKTA